MSRRDEMSMGEEIVLKSVVTLVVWPLVIGLGYLVGSDWLIVWWIALIIAFVVVWGGFLIADLDGIG